MSKQEQTEARKKSLERKLAAYSAAAGASLLAVAGADAQTIYTDYPDTTLSVGTPIYLDLNQDGPSGLGFDTMDDLSLQLGLVFENVGKDDLIAANLYLQHLHANSFVYGVRILGNYPTCTVGSAVFQSTCSSQPSANCYFYSSPAEAAQKGGTLSGPIPVPVSASQFDQFIRVGGFVTGLSSQAGKTQGVSPIFEGWIRFSVQELSGGGGDEVVPFEVVVKDHAIFVNPGETISCDASSLPVEFVSFEALTGSHGVELVWETASEINNAGFEVQYRAGDQDAFTALDFVVGAGTTTTPQQYTHTVGGLEPGPYVFRLKQIDLDGAFKYTDNLEVTVEVPGTHFLSSAYPNPFNPQTNFSLVVPSEQSVRVELFDALGRSVAVLYDGMAEADTPVRLTIQADDLPSGTYLYRAIGETFSDVRQVVLAR